MISMGTKFGWIGFGAGALLGIAGVGSVWAEPLGKEACETLAGEQQALMTAGVKADFDKGASWGKANLQGDRLKQVGRYIDVEEQLSFRCGLARVRFSLPADEETPAAPEEPKTAPKAKAKPKAGEAKAGEAKVGAEATPAGERPKPAPKIQAKLKPAPQPALQPAPAPQPAPKAEEVAPAKED